MCRQLVLFLVILLQAATFNIASSQSPKKISEIEGVTHYRLENGCQVLLFPVPSASSVTINMTVMVGSRHEGYGETGMAHLLEHMLFKGTPNHGDIDAELKKRGALEVNGTTDSDRTNYFETLPATNDNLDWAISMEADRLVNCFLRTKDLTSEMTVVRSEFERNENSPFQILKQRLLASAYDWHNYGKSTIGNKADIEHVPVERLRDFYRKYYCPDNAVLIVSGKFDAEKALASATKHFGSLSKTKIPLAKSHTTEPPQDGERIVYLNRPGDVPIVGVGYHIPAVSHPDFAAVTVLSQILDDEPNGLLYKSLVKNKTASSIMADVIPGHDPGMLLAYAMADKGQSISEIQSRLTSTIQSIANNGVSKRDVDRAVAQLYKQKEDDQTDPAQFAMTLSDWAAYGDWRLYFVVRDQITKVSTGDVKRVARQYLKKSNRTVAIFTPTADPDRSEVPNSPDLEKIVDSYKGSTGISAGEVFEPTPENIAARITRGKLRSGVKYALLPRKTRGDRFHINLTLRYGTIKTLNDPKLIAASELLAELLTTGTASLSYEKLQDRMTELKCEISTEGSPGELSFFISGRKENLEATLALLHDILRNPSLSKDELMFLQTESVVQYDSMKSLPNFLASIETSKRLTPVTPGNFHYVPDANELINRIHSVDIAAIKTLYNDFLSGAHGELTAVGAHDNEVMLEKFNLMLANWKSNQAYERIPQPYFESKTESVTIETPGKSNAILIFGANLRCQSDDPEWAALQTAADILGGPSMTSRLMARVRENEGLSYGVGCDFTTEPLDGTGLLYLYAITSPANKDKLLKTVDQELTRFIENGVTQKEVDDSRTSYLNMMEEDLSDSVQLLDILHNYQANGRDESFLKKRITNMKNLTVKDVNLAAKKLLNDKKLVTVAAGDFANAKPEDAVKPKKEK